MAHLQFLIEQGALSLLIILAAYTAMVIKSYLVFPPLSDNLWYAQMVLDPQESYRLFFRHFNYYATKILIAFFDNKLKGCAIASLCYHLGTGVLSFLIVYRISGKFQALLAVIFTLSVPVMFYQATLYGPDMPCLFFGLAAVYFSLSAHTPSRFPAMESFLAGFFLLAALFSKETGLVFPIPVLLILATGLARRYYKFFIGGILGAFLFMAACDLVWLGDFFYHLNPMHYFGMKNQFDKGLDESLEASGTKWGLTFIGFFLEQGYLHYFVFAIVYLPLLSFPGGRNTFLKKKLSFMIFSIGLISLLMHETVHVKDTILHIKDRWTHTVVIPVILAFSTLFSLPFAHKLKKNGGMPPRQAYVDLFLAGTFVLLIFLTQRQVDYFWEMLNHWKLGNSIIHVFSIWILIAGIAGSFYFSPRILFGNKNHFAWLGLMGLFVIIWFSVTWGHIVSSVKFKNIRARSAEIRTIAQALENKMHETILFNFDEYKLGQDTVLSMYIAGKIGKTDFQEIYHGRSPQTTDDLDPLTGGRFKYLLVQNVREIAEIREWGQKQNINLDELTQTNSMTLFRFK